jgi:DNA processing protein
MSDTGDLAAWIDLSLASGIGSRSFRSLLSAFGLPVQVLAANRSQLARVVSEPLAEVILDRGRGPLVEKTLAWATQPRHTILTLADSRYPRHLLEIPDPPALLYVVGEVGLLSSPALAVVGSRNATPQGIENARNFARTLSDSGLTIVSGLALGVDGAAHAGGLQGRGSTIAVLGTGIDIVYPKRNEALANEISLRGALVSEFPLGTPPKTANFPSRNRLISGLSRGCLVVEAAIDSGSLITARLAVEQGRDVFSIPGSIHSPLSKGCHALIKQGAKLVETAQDVLEESGFASGAVDRSPTSAESHLVLEKMGFDSCDIDRLISRTGLTAEVLSAMLLELELEGKIAPLPGGLYQRIL